jgi:glycosyltransferase involved in cell wall biosynthesis
MKISVCLIVKNEETCIEKCLESVKNADEIIVLDTGSTDKTGDIVRKYTDKYYPNEYKWEDSFCKARNYALSKCSGDWILSIDADEILELGGMEKIKKGIEFAEINKQKTINCVMVANISGDEFLFPRLFKRCPEVYWKGDIHNYLNVTDNNKSDIRITYSYSAAHSLDPNRSLRILLKVVKENPKSIREVFYLAREYFYRRDYTTAIYWYKDYLTRANWAPEWSEAWLMLSRCYWAEDKADEAKDACLQAIKINADFKEALLFMAEICGPKNRIKWLEYAELANSNDVLTLRTIPKEKSSEYYDKLFDNSSDMSRYYHIYDKISKMNLGSVLDIGCGVAMLQNFISDYHGFDFSKKAVEIANNLNVWVGNAYDIKNYGNYDTYIATEVLEHLDDIKILGNIPSGKKIIFSVPSFEDESHLRVYTEQLIKNRYKDILDIKEIYIFSWNNGWKLNKKLTNNLIYLVEAVKK